MKILCCTIKRKKDAEKKASTKTDQLNREKTESQTQESAPGMMVTRPTTFNPVNNQKDNKIKILQ